MRGIPDRNTSPKPLEFKWPLELTGHWLSARIVSQPSQWVCSLYPALLSKKEELINYIFKPLSLILSPDSYLERGILFVVQFNIDFDWSVFLLGLLAAPAGSAPRTIDTLMNIK